MRPRAAGIRHELHKRSRTRMRDALNTPKAAPEGGQGGRKPRLATATHHNPTVGHNELLKRGRRRKEEEGEEKEEKIRAPG